MDFVYSHHPWDAHFCSVLASTVRYITVLSLSERLLTSVSAIPLQKETTNGHLDSVTSLHSIYSFMSSHLTVGLEGRLVAMSFRCSDIQVGRGTSRRFDD